MLLCMYSLVGGVINKMKRKCQEKNESKVCDDGNKIDSALKKWLVNWIESTTIKDMLEFYAKCPWTFQDF